MQLAINSLLSNLDWLPLHQNMRVKNMLLLPLLALGFSTLAAPAAAETINVTVENLRNTKGIVRACLTVRADTFPRCDRDLDAQHVIVAARATVTFRFSNVTPGEYAIAVLHDENEDGKANRVLGMAPREGFGFSRDAPVRMAPPKWEDAVFTMGSSAQNMTILMRYFL